MFFRSSKTAPTKNPVREKIVALYDEVFFVCEDGKERTLLNTDEFWEQLLMLKINVNDLVSRLNKLTSGDIGALIVRKCADITVASLANNETTRCINGLSTASIVMRCLGHPTNLLAESDLIKISVSTLSSCAITFLSDDSYSSLCKKASVAWLLCLLASDERLGGTKYKMTAFLKEESETTDALQAVMRLLSNPSTRFSFGIEAVSLFSLLIQLPAAENQFPARFSISDDEAAINAMAQIIDGELSSANLVWRERLKQQQSKGMWNSLSSAIAGLLVGGDDQLPTTVLQPGLLLAFFYSTILNRHFMPTLSQTYPITSTSPSGTAPSGGNNSHGGAGTAAVENDHVLPPQGEKVPTTPSKHSPGTGPEDSSVLVTPKRTPGGNENESKSNAQASTDPSEESHQMPGNLLLTVIEYTSALLQDTRDESRRHAAHVCLMALEAIAEDPYANSVLHDDNLAFRPVIHRVQLRHRRAAAQPSPPRPLASALLDLAVEFICTHLMKSFPFELHYHSLSIVHRLLCYEKKAGIRLKVDWHELWSALTALMRFLTTNETVLMSNTAQTDSPQCSVAASIFSLVHLSVTILNMFITFGDAILSDPVSYDDLYYEIIRNADLFANIYQLCLRTCSSPQSMSPSPSRAIINTVKSGTEDDNSSLGGSELSSQKPLSLNVASLTSGPASSDGDSPGAAKAASVLHNIRAIIAHYSPLVDDLTEKRGAGSVTEADILELVRAHYDSLLLRVIDGTDSFDRFRGQALAPTACRNSLIALGDSQLADIRRRYSATASSIPNTDTLFKTTSSESS